VYVSEIVVIPDHRADGGGQHPVVVSLFPGRGDMRLILDAAVVLAYFVIGAILSERAHRHLVDPAFPKWDTPLNNPELFTPEGNRLRQRAMRFWTWGGGAVLLLVYLISR
jgi:hypothetical protein